MTTTETMTFTHHLDVPRTDDTFGLPNTWIHDRSLSFEGLGLIGQLLSYAPHEVITEAEVNAGRHPADPPLTEMVARLERAGYMRSERVGNEVCYELVHPDHLPPLDALFQGDAL